MLPFALSGDLRRFMSKTVDEAQATKQPCLLRRLPRRLRFVCTRPSARSAQREEAPRNDIFPIYN